MPQKNVHPKDKASIISRILLWWIVDLLWRGNRNPLDQEDLDPVREEDCAARHTKRLEEIWNNEKISAKRQRKKPKLWKALIKYFTWQEHALVNFLMLFNVFGNAVFFYSVTNLMKAIGSNFEQGTHSPNEYVIFVGGMMLGSFCEVLGSQHSCLLLPVLGIRARAALVGLIYKKVLRCSKMSMNAGEVMELVCDDTHRLATMGDQFLPNLVRQSAKVTVYIIWLLYFVGWKFLPGLGVFTVLALFRLCMTNIDIKYRRKASQLSEKRLGYLREVLTIINSVKLNCLEHVYEEKIQRTRWQEIKYKAKRWIILSASFSFTSCGQHLSTFVIVMVLIYTDRSMLTFNNLFTIMVLSVGIGEIICMKLPISIHFSTDIITGLLRIQRFLENCDATDYTIKEVSPTKDDMSIINRANDKSPEVLAPYVCLDNVSCKLLASSTSNANIEDTTLLTDISMEVSSEKLVIITGPVGSGKSLLLSSILKEELPIVKGLIKHSGSIAYVSDSPWVFPGTIRENILFGLAYDEEWYLQTIKACQLEKDFKRFPDRDLSHIGEHGATLSGGQRTRITLARAVYSRADIYLLDDPFSSLDAKVAENIFNNVCKGLLAERIVLAITLNARYLVQADYIIKMKEGMIVAQGMVEEVKKDIPELENAGNKENTSQETEEESEHAEADDDDLAEAEQLREAKEDREVGSVSFMVDTKYFMFGAPALVLLLILLIIVAGQGLTVWVDIQVSSLPNIVNEEEKFNFALIIYPVSLVVTILIVVLSRLCIFLLPIRANYRTHNKMVTCLLQAPNHFYAVNPAGRILNRFSQDINNLDDLLPFNLVYFFQCATPGFGAIVLCFLSSVYLIPVCFVAVGICIGVSKFFFNSAMDIKRLMSESGGPLYSHFSNTMEGVRTIRVHNRQQSFIDSAYRHIDYQHQAMFAYYTAARWFGITLDLVLGLFCVLVGLLELYTVKDSSTAVVAAVTIMYAFRSAGYTTGMVRSAVEVHAQMTSAERILAYTEIVPEKGRNIKKQPRKGWPESGMIQFNDVSLRHYKEGPKVLKNLTFEIEPSEKIGIVGRTGAGKSSLVAALMRIGLTEGDIRIDNLSIEDVNVISTRQRISVISQSPVLFSGTIRENLNPTGELDDSEIWNALDQLQLSVLVGSLPGKLDSECTGGGSNFSVGQRQLLHLARVLLKQNKIIIFDEATGKVDKKTAEQIQNVIHGVFKDCTVITVSHRIGTIEECDRIMVLDQGSIVEFDKPDVLLNKEKGVFLELKKIANEA